MTLLIVTAFIPLGINADENVNNDCGCSSNGFINEYSFKRDIPKDKNYIAPKQTINGLPDYFNWKNFGGQDWTTSAKAQSVPQQCGSCWIFAGIGILESNINIREGSAVIDADLSEQYVLSCLPNATYPHPPGTGCSGGDTILALKYMMETTENGNYYNGALLEECFPYQADDTIPCSDKCPDWIDKLVPILDCYEWWSTGNNQDINLIKSQILEKGPVLACMMATVDFINWGWANHDPNDYYPYQNSDDINHIVDIVGWKDDSSISKGGYWICKNSWGTEWGYDGFFNLEYGSLMIDKSFVNWVDYDSDSYDWGDEPYPPNSPMIAGETKGSIKTEYEYTFKAVDPEDKNVKYYISWGDGNWEWTDYSSSGEDVTVKHTWSKEGDFSVVALAMNADGTIGPWGTLEVTMPVNNVVNRPILKFLEQYPILYHLLQRFFQF